MPSPGEDVQSWSTNATLNGNVDPLINWSEGQPRASVNNSSRSMLAAIAKDRDLKNGSIVTSGTADAQTFFSGVNYTSVPTGLTVRLKIGGGLTNTAAATLNMDNIGAVAIKNTVGGDIVAKALTENAYVDLVYDGTNWVLLAARSEVVLLATTVITVAAPVATVDFTTIIDGTFKEYLCTGISITSNTDSDALFVRVSEDNGATWKSGANDYQLAAQSMYANVTVPGQWQGSPALNRGLLWAAQSKTPPITGNFEMRLFDPSSTNNWKAMAFHASAHHSTYGMAAWIGTNWYTGNTVTTAPVNAVRFGYDTGPIQTGIFSVHGIVK